MKYYATVQSERATKGQGGQSLLIRITDENKKQLCRVYVNPATDAEDGRDGTVVQLWEMNQMHKELFFGAETYEDRKVREGEIEADIRAKGKRQKGEYEDCWCDKEGLVQPHNKHDHIVNRTH